MGVLSKLAGRRKPEEDDFLDLKTLDRKGGYGPAGSGLDAPKTDDMGLSMPSMAGAPSDTSKDIALINSRLETLKAEIDGIKHRLADIERRLQLRAEQSQTERYGTSAGASAMIPPAPQQESGWHF